MKKMLLAIAMVLGTVSAHATEAPAWVCHLGFKGEAHGFKVLVGNYHYHAKGNLDCVSLTGRTVHYPIKIEMKAKPLSPQIAFGHMELIGQAAEISLLDTTPESIFGSYLVGQGQAAVLGGVGIISATRIEFPAIAMQVSLQFAKGFGVNLGLNKMKITLDQDQN